MSRATIAVSAVAGVAAAGGLSAAYAVAGLQGVYVLGIAFAAITLLAWRGMLPPAGDSGGRRRRGAAPAVQAADFPAYRAIVSDLSWAESSRRHYDRVTRPMLSRLLGARLAQRHRLDLATRPDEARRLVGEELWPLVDPSLPASEDSNAPGTDLRTVARVVDRLEKL